MSKTVQDAYKKAFISAEKFVSQPRQVIPVNPAMDIMLSGGIPSGSFVICTGKQKLGKTTACLHFASKAQQLGFKVYFFNIEGRLKKRDLEGIKGLSLDEDKFQIIGSTNGNILSAEDYLDIVTNLNETEQNCIFIMDSISQLCSSARFSSGVGDRFRDDVPLMLGALTKRVSNILPVNNNVLICITHIVANQGGGPAQWMEASGQKIQYQADVKIKATFKQDHLEKDNIIGQVVHWECGTSALGPPSRKCTTLLRYGEGLDDVFDIVSMCVDIGIISKGGAWFTLPNEDKIQGLEKTVQHIKDRPEIYEDLLTKFNELMK